MENCIFCKIVKGEIPCSKIYEDDFCFAFMDIQPINEGHVLVVPKMHAEILPDLDDEFAKEMLIAAKKINKAIRKSKIKSEGINLYISDGKAAGQEVPHLHLHIIPRFSGDGLRLIRPKNEKPNLEVLKKIADEIGSKM